MAAGIGLVPPNSRLNRNGAKSDELDAVRAAREALSREHLAAPRARGDREAMRVLLTARQGAVVARTKAIGQLKALIVNASGSLRDQLGVARPISSSTAVPVCARSPPIPSSTAQPCGAIRAVARRALALEAEAAEYETGLEELVTAACPEPLQRPGAGVITAAQFIVSWPYSERIRNEAAFAALAGVAPIPASSGATIRRLNRSGDRQPNRALHTVALSRLQHHDETKTYASRRTAEVKRPRGIYRTLEAHAKAIRRTVRQRHSEAAKLAARTVKRQNPAG